PRVTHPSAARSTSARPEGRLPASRARLACIRHAASVRPEPRSNSPKKFAKVDTDQPWISQLSQIDFRVDHPSDDGRSLSSDICSILVVLFSFQRANYLAAVFSDLIILPNPLDN